MHMSQEETRTVTMEDLARAAGVSQPTVSRALRGDPRISEETKRKVEAMAQRLGYRPDPTLSALMVYRSGKKPAGDHGKIAIVNLTMDKRMDIQKHADLALKLRGVERQAHALGYSTEIFPLGPKPEEQRRLSRILYAQGIRGLIVSPQPKGFPLLSDFEWKHFSAVALGYSIESPLLNYVAQDQRTELLYEKLRELGYRRIGFCIPVAREENYRYSKLGAYLKCLFMDGIPSEQSPPFFYDRWDTLTPEPWVKRHKFDAVMTTIVPEFSQALEGSNLANFHRLGVAALSIAVEEPGNKDVTGIVENITNVGSAAVDLLHQLICHGKRGVPANRQAIILEGKWQRGITAPGKRS